MVHLTLDIVAALNSPVSMELYYPGLEATRDLFSIVSHTGVSFDLKSFWELGLPVN